MHTSPDRRENSLSWEHIDEIKERNKKKKDTTTLKQPVFNTGSPTIPAFK